MPLDINYLEDIFGQGGLSEICSFGQQMLVRRLVIERMRKSRMMEIGQIAY